MPAQAPASPAPWLLACLFCAVAGFFTGRQADKPTPSRPSTRSTPALPASLSPAEAPNSGQPDASTHAFLADRRRALAALLRGFGSESESMELDSLMELSAWVGTADPKELADVFTWTELPLQSEQAAIVLQLLVFSRWASLDGAGALKACLAQTKNRTLLDAIFKSWMRNGNARAAIDHALALQRSDPDALPLIGELMTAWYKQDPASAASRARELAISENALEREAARRVAAEAARRSLNTEGVDAALNFVSAWPDPEAHDKLLVSLLVDWNSGTSRDLDAAARILSRVRDAQSVASPDALAPLASSIDHLLLTNNAAEVRRWCASLPAAFQPLAVNQIAQKLAARDQWRDALAWLQAHPAPPRIFADAYEQAASAAARAGEMTRALSLPGHDGLAPWPFGRGPRLLQDWIDGDPARGKLLIDFIVATESAEAPGSPAP